MKNKQEILDDHLSVNCEAAGRKLMTCDLLNLLGDIN